LRLAHTIRVLGDITEEADAFGRAHC